MVWVCKKHGKGCDSYLKGVIEELNKNKLHPKEIYNWVEWIPEPKKEEE